MTDEIRKVLELARHALVHSICAVSPKPEDQLEHAAAVEAIDKLLKNNGETSFDEEFPKQKTLGKEMLDKIAESFK